MKEQYLEQVSTSIDNYYQQVLLFCMGYITFNNNPFSSEEIIEAYKVSAFPQPREYRVFGAAMKHLKKQGWIEHYGFAIYKNPSGHKKPVNVWIKKKEVSNDN